MKYCFLIFALFLITVNLSSAPSLNAKYELTTLEPEIRYSLELNNGHYNLIANHYFQGGSVVEVYLSCGKFTRKGKLIEFTDAIRKFTMSYFYYNNYLKPNKTFGSLGKKLFFKIKNNTGKSFSCNYRDEAIIKKKRLYNTKTNTNYHTCYLGKYTNNNYSLELLSKNRFIYSYCDGIILTGEFIRKNNELQLHDSSLNHVFYFSIYKKMIEDGFNNDGSMLVLIP